MVEDAHYRVVVGRPFDFREEGYHGRNHGLYQGEGNRLLLCAFDRLDGVSEVFAEVRSMLAEVVGPCSCFGPRWGPWC